jgi:tRNA-splicing ligase RtcB
MISIEGKYSTAHIMVEDPDHIVDPATYEQILGFVNNHVFTKDPRIMPDYHYGSGSCIGFTAPLTDKVIPNVVGVDIG